MSTLKYLMQQLSFNASEWSTLTDEDKSTLKRWAAEEMAVLGIEVK
jgi:hypothetical protein